MTVLLNEETPLVLFGYAFGAATIAVYATIILLLITLYTGRLKGFSALVAKGIICLLAVLTGYFILGGGTGLTGGVIMLLAFGFPALCMLLALLKSTKTTPRQRH